MNMQTVTLAGIKGGVEGGGIKRAGARPQQEKNGAFASAMDSAKTPGAGELKPKDAESAEKPKTDLERTELPEEPADEPKAEDMIITAMVQSALQVVQTEPEADEQTQQVQAAAPDAGVEPAGTEAGVVTVLEGDKDAEAPKTGQTDLGEKARMPQDGTGKDLSATQTVAAGGDSCPLENENDGSSDKSGGVVKTAATEENKTEKDAAATESQPQAGVVLDVAPERVSGDFQMKAAAEVSAAREPVTTDNLFEALVDSVEMNRGADSSEMRIQLKPDFLGHVELQLKMGEGGMQVKISAEDANVKEMIGGQITALIESLSGKGIKIAEVEVVYTGVSDQNLADAQNSGGDGGQSQKRPQDSRQSDRISDYGGFHAETPPAGETGLSDGEISSVEYRA